MGKPIIFPGAIKRLKQFLTGKYIEETNIASQNIPAGKWVIWKNQMCQAKTAITTGDTLSSTNLDTVGDEGAVNALNSKVGTCIAGELTYGTLNRQVVDWNTLGVSIPDGYKVVSLSSWTNYNGVSSCLNVGSSGTVYYHIKNWASYSDYTNVKIGYSIFIAPVS